MKQNLSKVSNIASIKTIQVECDYITPQRMANKYEYKNIFGGVKKINGFYMRVWGVGGCGHF